MRGWRSSATPPARSGARRIWRGSRRSASAARRCRASPRSRISSCAAARAAPRPAPRSASTAARWRRSPKSGWPEGTAIDVADLFYNLPARRKFLKSDGAESAQVSRIVTQLALCYPEIGFTLTSAGRKVIQCPPVASLRDRLYQLYGERDDLVEVRRDTRRREGARLHRGAGGAGADARSAERVRQPAHRQGPHDRARHHRFLQRGVDQGAQPRGAPVHRDAARRGRRERPPDQGGGALPRPVAHPRGDSPHARRRARPRPRAGAAARSPVAVPTRPATTLPLPTTYAGTFPSRWVAGSGLKADTTTLVGHSGRQTQRSGFSRTDDAPVEPAEASHRSSAR